MSNRLKKKVVSSSWLTSFGDLLTLLLCFFVCIISFGGLGETSVNKTASNKEDSGSGISLAGVNSNGSLVELLITEAQHQGPANLHMERFQEMVQAKVDSQNSYIHSAVIESCFNKLEMYEGESWHESMERSLALRRQLVDYGLAEEDVAVRAVGPWCAALSHHMDSEDFVSRIVLQVEQVVNG